MVLVSACQLGFYARGLRADSTGDVRDRRVALDARQSRISGVCEVSAPGGVNTDPECVSGEDGRGVEGAW